MAAKKSPARPARKTAPSRAKAAAPKKSVKRIAKSAKKAPAKSKPATKSAKVEAKKAVKKTTSKAAPKARRSASPAGKKVVKAKAAIAPKSKAGKSRPQAAPRKSLANSSLAPEPSIPQRSDVPLTAENPLRIALFGASGNVGSRIAKEAIARGHRVTALVRQPDKFTLEAPNLRKIRGDVTDPIQVAIALRNHDIVASAVSPPAKEPTVLVDAANALLAAAKETGKRVVAVGGAGSLEVAPGKQLVDTPEFGAAWRPVALAHRDALRTFQKKGEGTPWTVVSPSSYFEPGERTGQFRLGTDQLLVDKKGISRISMEDYAIAFVDELERGDNVGKRITVGY